MSLPEKNFEVPLKGNIFPGFKVANFDRGFVCTHGSGVGFGTGHCSKGQSVFSANVVLCHVVQWGKMTGARRRIRHLAPCCTLHPVGNRTPSDGLNCALRRVTGWLIMHYFLFVGFIS